MEYELACVNSEAKPSDSINADWVEVVMADKQLAKKIFLSHSGAQKDFVEQLCEDLERAEQPPFFDKRLDSLPKGERFAPLIFKAIQSSELTVVVVSEEYFTKSKWPMLELASIVQGAGCKILPLFFGLSCEEYKNLKRREQWFQVWDKWSKEDDRICLDVWRAALWNLDGINGMEYVKATGEVAYRRQIVTIVCDIMQRRSVQLPEIVMVDVNECALHELGEDIATSKFKLGVSSGCLKKVALLQVVVGLTMLLLLCGYDHFHNSRGGSLSRSNPASDYAWRSSNPASDYSLKWRRTSNPASVDDNTYDPRRLQRFRLDPIDDDDDVSQDSQPRILFGYDHFHDFRGGSLSRSNPASGDSGRGSPNISNPFDADIHDRLRILAYGYTA